MAYWVVQARTRGRWRDTSMTYRSESAALAAWERRIEFLGEQPNDRLVHVGEEGETVIRNGAK